MKKLYFLSLSIGLALSASAVVPQFQQAPSKSAANAMNLTKAEAAPMRNIKKAPADDHQWTLLGEGFYAASVVADTYGFSNAPIAVQVYEASDAKGVYKVESPWQAIDVYTDLVIDASDPDFVVVDYQDTGVIDNVDGVTYIASNTYVYTVFQGMDKAEVSSYLQGEGQLPTMKDGVIYFPVKSLLLQWPEAPADSKYGIDPAGWYIGKNNGYLVLPGGEYQDPWTSLGDATFTDNFIAGAFGVTVDPYEVELKYNETEKKYQVIDPLKGFYDAQGWSSTSPTMTIDANDPDNCIIGQTSSGVSGGSDGLYYYLSDSAYNDLMEGDASLTEEDLRITVAVTEEKVDDTHVNNVTTITIPYRSMYLLASSTGSLYYTGTEGTVTTIVNKSLREIPAVGIDAIVNDNAPVRYFNLQGVEVANPAKGELVIKTQGGKAVKTIVR